MTYEAWTPEQDAILHQCKTPAKAAKVLGKTRYACASRLRRLRGGPIAYLRLWTPEEDAILLAAPSARAASRLLDRSRQACMERRQKLKSALPLPRSFLEDLAAYERHPANVAVRESTPILHNPSAYHGSGCSSSANMD